jgi:ankyrin repeat protein
VNIASERGYDRVLKLLLDYGANPNEDGHFPQVPLSLAIKNGHDAAVRVLLAREATNVTLPSDPFSQQPLHYALQRGSLEYFLLLLGRGADIQEYES